jgi:hypothetical protein
MVDLSTHELSCNSSRTIRRSEIFSERWTRLKNNDKGKDQFLTAVVSSELNAVVSSKFNDKVLAGYEVSVSKVPGDFSDSSCKATSNSSGSRSSVWLAQSDGGNTYGLEPGCLVNADESKHFYINVRSLEKGTNNVCGSPSNACKFQIDQQF